MSHGSVIRQMIEWRERKLIENDRDDFRNNAWRKELVALRSALVCMENDPERRIKDFPQGIWSDHHAAIHSDCEWDWTAVNFAIARMRAENEVQEQDEQNQSEVERNTGLQ